MSGPSGPKVWVCPRARPILIDGVSRPSLETGLPSPIVPGFRPTRHQASLRFQVSPEPRWFTQPQASSPPQHQIDTPGLKCQASTHGHTFQACPVSGRSLQLHPLGWPMPGSRFAHMDSGSSLAPALRQTLWTQVLVVPGTRLIPVLGWPLHTQAQGLPQYQVSQRGPRLQVRTPQLQAPGPPLQIQTISTSSQTQSTGILHWLQAPDLTWTQALGPPTC